MNREQIPSDHADVVLDRFDLGIASAVFLAAMVIYIRTLATGLLLGDSAEFQVLGYTLGMAHTTGYPVYLFLVKLVTLLPIQDIAYRINLASAIFGALTLSGLYLLGRSLGGWRMAALVGPLALALTRLFWWHSVIAEVYTPAAFFVVAVLLLVVLWRQTRKAWLLFAAGFLGGLTPGMHGLAVLIAPAVVVYLVLTARRKVDWKMAVLGGLAGLLVFLGAFWVIDRIDVPTSVYFITYRPNLTVWNLTPDQFNSSFWTRFYVMVSGRQFHEAMFSVPEARVKLFAENYFFLLKKDFPRLILYLAGAGLASMFAYPWRRGARNLRFQWREAFLLLLAWLGMMVFVINYEIGDIQVFYIQGFVPLLAFASPGVSFAFDLLARLMGLIRKMPSWPLKLTSAALALLCMWMIVSPYLPALRSSWKMKRITFLDLTDDRWYPYPVRDAKWPRYVGETISRHVEDDAMIFTTWDIIYPILYVTHIEQGRTEIQAFELFNSLYDAKPSPYTLDMIRENFGIRPIYFTDISQSGSSGLRFKQVGYKPDLFRVVGIR